MVGDELHGCDRLSIYPARTAYSRVSKLFRFRLFGPVCSECFQSRDPLPDDGFEPLAQGLRVVSDEFGPVTRMSALDVEVFCVVRWG